MKQNQVKILVLKALQESGVDFGKDFFSLSYAQIGIIKEACRDLHYQQSPTAQAMGRTNAQSFYYSLQSLAEKLSK